MRSLCEDSSTLTYSNKYLELLQISEVKSIQTKLHGTTSVP